jgi:fatty acid desaturase
MFENSRTTRSLAPIRRLAWNMPYHAEHHACPALPFHTLPAAHRLLRSRIAVQAPGYVAVHREILAGLRRGDAAPEQAALSRSVQRS